MIYSKILGKIVDAEYKNKLIDFVDFEWHETYSKLHRKTSHGGRDVAISLDDSILKIGIKPGDVFGVDADGTVIAADVAESIAAKTAERFPMPEQAAPVPDFSSSPEANNPFDTTGSEDNGSVFDITPEESAFGAALDQPSAFSGLAEQNRSFTSFQNTLNDEQLRNLQLIMNVPLELSIEIGSTQKRVDEILSFSYGTVIELDSLADAPVNVIVNGHLIAKGDVVVVDDYFAVRITEIVKSDLLDTLSTKE